MTTIAAVQNVFIAKVSFRQGLQMETGDLLTVLHIFVYIF